jgi:hypothetical protein
MGKYDRCAIGKCNNARAYKENYVIKPHIGAFDGSLCLNQFHGCPSPPGRLSGICHFGEKMLQMPHHGVQIMQQNPHPWGLTLTQMPHPWGQNISFLRIFENRFCSYFVSKRFN